MKKTANNIDDLNIARSENNPRDSNEDVDDFDCSKIDGQVFININDIALYNDESLMLRRGINE